jgi:hypothetical protein
MRIYDKNELILLDACILSENLDTAKAKCLLYRSLYKGSIGEALADLAPYLFDFSDAPDFRKWYMENGWGNAWGIMMQSTLPFEETYRHFRKFLLVKTEEGEELYFRFYDPRVLRVFLPTCDAAQLKDFFGPVDYFICEDEDAAFGLVFSFEHGLLKTTKVPKQNFFDTERAKRKFFPDLK